MAYLGGDMALLFGGYTGWDYSDETWTYDLDTNTWKQPSPASNPSARSAHAMAYIGEGQVLLFGGHAGADYSNETWLYNFGTNTWALQSPTTGPSARRGHTMAYLGGDQVLLFGGFGYGSRRGDTWLYDLSDNTWTLQSPTASPSARSRHAMAYLGGDQALLFGGDVGAHMSDETWLYDLSDNAWTLQSSASNPNARVNHAMAHIGGDQALLFSGIDENTILQDDTWIAAAPTPTAVNLASFSASTAAGGAIRLDWETASELDNLGFNLYRAESPQGERLRLNATLIPSQNPGSPVGAAYAWLDEAATPGVTYHYWLEAVDVHGAATLYGPVSGMVQPLQRLLPTRPRLAPDLHGLRGQ